MAIVQVRLTDATHACCCCCDAVHVSQVRLTDATATCDELFDMPTDGVSAIKLPNFPSAERLGDTWRIGMITGASGGTCQIAQSDRHEPARVLLF